MKGIKVQSLIIVIVAFLVIILYGILKPQPTDWKYSFSSKEKIPFGLYVLKSELENIFDGGVSEDMFYRGSGDDGFYDDVDEVTIMYINIVNDWDFDMSNMVLSAVSSGHSAFISTTQLPLYLADSLGLGILRRENYRVYLKDSLLYTLENKGDIKLIENIGVTGSYIYRFDTLSSLILGYVYQDTLKPNFIKISYGLGYFYIHTEPVLLTNYHLLNGNNYRYGEALLSHLPKSNGIVWGEFLIEKKVIKGGVLRYIMSQPSLKWAWFVLLTGLIVFIITHMRRPQRVIPIILPTENTTLKFVGSIGDLYMRRASIRHLLDRKIIYLLERIRSQYFISTDKLDDGFTSKLSQLSGKNIEIVKQIVFLVQKHRETDYNCTADDLRRLNQAIENFYS